MQDDPEATQAQRARQSRRNAIRRTQTQRELTRLESEIGDWLRRLADADPVGQHKSQRETLRTVLADAAAGLRSSLENLDLAADNGRFYSACRDFDRAAVWLRRLWDFYAAKFAQHDDPTRIGPLLKAADEVVWSCYRPVFLHPRVQQTGIKSGPPPLCYIEPEHSPGAVEADTMLPVGLRPAIGEADFIENCVKTIPVPLLRLPPWCVDSPWWLVYVGHEIGHHVQHDLGLVGTVKTGLVSVATRAGSPQREADAWGVWGEEIFADCFSILTMGASALRALAEIEQGPEKALRTPRAAYPSPLIRLELMRETVRALGLTESAPEWTLPPAEDDPRTARDRAVVAPAIDFLLRTPLPKGIDVPLPALLGWDQPGAARTAEATIAQWATRLISATPPQGAPVLNAARQAVSGATLAWAKAVDEAVENPLKPIPDAFLDQLAERTIATVKRCSPPGTRAAAAMPAEPIVAGANIAARLLAAVRASGDSDADSD